MDPFRLAILLAGFASGAGLGAARATWDQPIPWRALCLCIALTAGIPLSWAIALRGSVSEHHLAVALASGGALALLLAGGFLSGWTAARALRTSDPTPDASPASPPLLAAAAWETIEEALRQKAQRAFTAWWRGLSGCPLCGRAGLSRDRGDPFWVSDELGYSYTAVRIALDCRSCGWNHSFPHSDGARGFQLNLGTNPATYAALAIRWRASRDGSTCGEIDREDESRWRVRVAPDAAAVDRAALHLAAHLLRELCVHDIAPIAPRDALRIITSLTREHVGVMFSARLELALPPEDAENG